MDKFKIINQVASGLRQIAKHKCKQPDAFLFADGPDDDQWTWDDSTILDIPVFHTNIDISLRTNSIGERVVFIPIWKEEGNYLLALSAFAHGYLKKEKKDAE